tara:strand:- start:307 stop:534 length:228 start_codon:yes stop_codon:yes gene_type:complete
MKCYEYCASKNRNCKESSCRYWLDNKSTKNCTILAAKIEKNMTLEEIGNIFKVTRMRICQIEKRAIEKIKEKLTN